MRVWWIRCFVGAVLNLCPMCPPYPAGVASAQAHAQPQEAPLADTADTANTAPSDATVLVSRQRVDQLLKRYRLEPSVAQVTQAALRQQRIRPQRVAQLAAQARVAGWLPKLRLSATRGQTIALLAAQSTTVDRNSATTGNNITLQAQLSWDLADVVWSGQELRVERELRAERKAQQELVEWVSTLYFERRRLLIERDLNPAVTLANELRIADIEDLLDVLTGGAFGPAVRESRAAH